MRRVALALALLAGAAEAQPAPEATARFGSEQAPGVLTVLGTTDVALFAPLLEAFADSTPELAVHYEQWASNDLHAVAAAACRGERPPADLIVSSAVDLQVKLVNDGCAQPHRSVPTAALPAAANWRDELFGVTEEPAVIVYNRDLVPPDEAPRTRFDLIDLLRPADSRYAGRVATYDIEDSGLGYLFAFADSQQATTFGEPDRGLRPLRRRRHLLLGRDHRWRRRGPLPDRLQRPRLLRARPGRRAIPRIASSRPRTTPSCCAARR